jgi:predicted RNA-binding Zn-ribbon protein involved in translation (DUF1610 family)
MEASGLAFGEGFASTMSSPLGMAVVWATPSPRCPQCNEELEPVMSGIPFPCPYCDEVILLLSNGKMEHLGTMPFPPGIAGVPTEG